MLLKPFFCEEKCVETEQICKLLFQIALLLWGSLFWEQLSTKERLFGTKFIPLGHFRESQWGVYFYIFTPLASFPKVRDLSCYLACCKPVFLILTSSAVSFGYWSWALITGSFQAISKMFSSWEREQGYVSLWTVVNSLTNQSVSHQTAVRSFCTVKPV